MIIYTIVYSVIGSNTFIAGAVSLDVLMKMLFDPGLTNRQCIFTIVLSTSAAGAIGLYTCRLVYASATVLMFVAMLATATGAREPFKSKLIFSDFHNISLVPLLRVERRKLLLLREPTLPICPQGLWYLRVGTIHRPSPYQDDALPLSYEGITWCQLPGSNQVPRFFKPPQ